MCKSNVQSYTQVFTNEEIWPSSESDDDPQQSHTQTLRPIPTPLQQFFLFTLFWQSVYSISTSAISCLLRFMRYFVKAIGLAFHCEGLVDAANSIPLGLKAVNKLLGIDPDDFVTYVVCPSCHSVYSYDDCIIKRAYGRSESKHCCHVAYPKHPHRSRRKACGAQLLKKVRTKSGQSLKPFKVYPYRPLKASIAHLVRRPGFLECCEKWRSRSH